MSILKIENDENICVDALKRYTAFHETLTPKTVLLFPKYFAHEARYQAPMIDISGKQAIGEFWVARRDAFSEYKLKIRHTSWHEDGYTAYVRWDCIGLRGVKRVVISGMSEVTFSLKGQILSHVDYYDPLSAFLYDVPVLGGLLKSRRKIAK